MWGVGWGGTEMYYNRLFTDPASWPREELLNYSPSSCGDPFLTSLQKSLHSGTGELTPHKSEGSSRKRTGYIELKSGLPGPSQPSVVTQVKCLFSLRDNNQAVSEHPFRAFPLALEAPSVHPPRRVRELLVQHMGLRGVCPPPVSQVPTHASSSQECPYTQFTHHNVSDMNQKCDCCYRAETWTQPRKEELHDLEPVALRHAHYRDVKRCDEVTV